SSVLCKAFKELSSICHAPRFWRESGCKGTNFFRTDKYFRDIFTKKMHFCLILGLRQAENAQKNVQKRQFWGTTRTVPGY
ncbi:MAG: hypothetical protein IJ527_03620, partial [Prevotella sp.]|nr:hypothetical protein [Prevotella sp.]